MMGWLSPKELSLQSFTVHAPPGEKADRIERAEDLVFVKDGFSWLTAVAPPLGFLQQRLWLLAIVYIALVTALSLGLSKAGASEDWIAIIVLAINIYLGFEISSFKRWWLDLGGWEQIGSVNGKNEAECERRFYESWLPQQPIVALPTSAPPAQSGRRWPFARGA